MRLGLFVPTLSKDYNCVSASIWIRVLQMLKYYRELGVEVHLNNPLLRYDVSIVYRIPTKKFLWLIKYLKTTSRKVYFDTVVNYFEQHDHATDKYIYHQKKIADICDGIICSTEPIADSARQYNDNVYVFDDPIDTDQFGKIKRSIDYSNPLFGWSGVSSKAHYLNKFGSEINGKIKLITDIDIFNKKLNFQFNFSRWRYETFTHSLLQCDIALLPRSVGTDPYNQGHSSFKALVFAVCGIPVIANRIPSYQKLSQYYNAIVFLEDHEDDIQSCIDTLTNVKPILVEDVRMHFGCNTQAYELISFLRSRC